MVADLLEVCVVRVGKVVGGELVARLMLRLARVVGHRGGHQRVELLLLVMLHGRAGVLAATCCCRCRCGRRVNRRCVRRLAVSQQVIVVVVVVVQMLLLLLKVLAHGEGGCSCGSRALLCLAG